MIKVTERFNKFIEIYYSSQIVYDDSIQYSNNKEKYINRFSNYEVLIAFEILLRHYKIDGFDLYRDSPTHPFSSFRPITIDEEYNYIINYLGEEIEKLVNKPIRYKVVGKYYNYTNNSFEYELENGEFIINNKKYFEKVEIPYDIFPREFLRMYNMEIYRLVTINDIVK